MAIHEILFESFVQIGTSFGNYIKAIGGRDPDGNAKALALDQNGNLQVGIADTGSLDAFGRIRVSNLKPIFDIQHEYDESPFSWETSLTGGATITHDDNTSSVLLSNTTASGDIAIRQTKQYFRYQPGRSQIILFTGVFGNQKEGVRKRLGCFDSENGLYFEQVYSAVSGESLKVCKRTNTSGSVVNTEVLQKNWNLDTLDGSGPSGITLDMSKTQIFIIEFQWLGVGRVRFGFDIDGKMIYCHEMKHANNETEVYMRTPNLPLRYEIENTGATSTPTALTQICSLVASEDGQNHLEQSGLIFTDGNGATSISCSARRPIFSIRLKNAFKTIANRGIVVPLGASFFADAAAYFEVILNGSLTAASFSSYNANSLVERDIAATGISGGYRIGSAYVEKAGRAGLQEEISSKIPMTVNMAANDSDILTVVATPLGSNSACYSELIWKEIY